MINRSKTNGSNIIIYNEDLQIFVDSDIQFYKYFYNPNINFITCVEKYSFYKILMRRHYLI